MGVLLLALTLALTGAQASKAASFNPDPVFPVGPISGTASHQIVELENVASALAGRHTTVNCWSQRDWTRFNVWQGEHHLAIDPEGVTFTATHRIQLAPFVCQILQQTLACSAEQPLYTADAVTVLAHESAHASGIKAENLAECRAIKTDPRAAELLGIPKAVGARLQHIYRGTIYPNDLPEYRTPPCKAGRPGAVVPDTLGTSAHLRPLKRMVTAAARALPGWLNLGGTVGPLAPCAPVASRALELARFSETLTEPPGEFAAVGAATVRTQKEYATALARYRSFARCDLAERRTQLRESHSSDTVSLGAIPGSIAGLSPQVHAFRDVYTHEGEKQDVDTITIFDPAKREFGTIEIGAGPASTHGLSTALERRVTAAALHALLQRG